MCHAQGNVVLSWRIAYDSGIEVGKKIWAGGVRRDVRHAPTKMDGDSMMWLSS